MIQPQPSRMTADEFLAWAEVQPGRYELEGGQVYQMAPERVGHARAKGRIYRLLQDAVAAAKLDCEVFPDGMAVQVSEDTVYEPDASIRCGPLLPETDLKVLDPMIVVEILSPSTQALDLGGKFANYFRIPSVRHYVIVKLEGAILIHHRRADDGTIATRIIGDNVLTLDPPGLVLRDVIRLPA